MKVTAEKIDLTEYELDKRLGSVFKLYPRVEEAQNFFDYESLKTGETSYYMSNKVSEDDKETIASYMVFPTYQNLVQFMKYGIELEKNPNAKVNIKDNDLVYFIVEKTDDGYVGEAEFYGKLDKLSDEEKNEILDQFINGLDRAYHLVRMYEREKEKNEPSLQ